MFYCPKKGLLKQHQPYENALGIKSVRFSNNGEFLAVGSYDQVVRIFNCLTWDLITEFKHTKNVQKKEDMFIFQEENADGDGPGYRQ